MGSLVAVPVWLFWAFTCSIGCAGGALTYLLLHNGESNRADSWRMTLLEVQKAFQEAQAAMMRAEKAAFDAHNEAKETRELVAALPTVLPGPNQVAPLYPDDESAAVAEGLRARRGTRPYKVAGLDDGD